MPRLGPEKGWMLRVFGAHVDQAFGHIPYHVGSSLTADTWRDVDVRLILPDEEYAALFVAEKPVEVPRERVLMWNLAWSAFGTRMTRLPIDFQFQSQTLANAEYPGPRGALLLLDRELPVAHPAPPRTVLDPETGIAEPVTTGRIPDAEFVEPPLMPGETPHLAPTGAAPEIRVPRWTGLSGRTRCCRVVRSLITLRRERSWNQGSRR